MLKFSEFTNGIEEALSDWTHKLGFNDLTPEMRDQVNDKHKNDRNKPAVGDKYNYHFNITKPPKDYRGHLPYGIYSHRSINPISDNGMTSDKISDANMDFSK